MNSEKTFRNNSIVWYNEGHSLIEIITNWYIPEMFYTVCSHVLVKSEK